MHQVAHQKKVNKMDIELEQYEDMEQRLLDYTIEITKLRAMVHNLTEENAKLNKDVIALLDGDYKWNAN
jgi:regulator of replication initiation timing